MPTPLAVLMLSAAVSIPALFQPAAKPAVEPLPPAAGSTLPDINSVLTRLESADKDLKSLTAAVSLIKHLPAIEGGGMEVRWGVLKFTSENDGQPVPLRRFSIAIDTETIEGKAFRNPDGGPLREFIFDGQYLLETWPKQKQFVRRHITGADRKKDPLRIGEGPFPIPVGQRKDDLLARFAVTVVQPLEEAPANDQLRRILVDCTQLKLVPKAGTEQAKVFSEIRLWYRTTDMLPLFAKTVNVDSSGNEVNLTSIVKNPAIPASAFDTSVQGKRAQGWQGEEQDLRNKVEIVPGDPAARPAASPVAPDPKPAVQPSASPK